jgi:hypothetical protein
MMNRRSASILAVTGVALLALLAGCQAVFTYSPLSFLQRDPADLPPDQQVSWAEQALASGDPQAMAQAYDLVKGDPDQAYLAASLAAELSGVTQALADAIADLATISGWGWTSGAEAEAYLDAFLASIVPSYTEAAGALFGTLVAEAVLAGNPGDLSGTDMLVGALCLAFDAADPGGFATADFTVTYAFIADCQSVLSSDDLANDLLDQVTLLGT